MIFLPTSYNHIHDCVLIVEVLYQSDVGEALWYARYIG